MYKNELPKIYPVLFFTLIGMMLIVSCNKEIEKKNFFNTYKEAFVRKYPVLNSKNWIIQNGQITDEEISLKLYRELKELNINVDLVILTNGKDTTYNIRNYITHFQDKSYNYYTHLKEGKDTLYYYKSLKSDTDPMNYYFIRGKYRYMFDNIQLNSNQAAFFTLNQDSLTRVKGNDLPSLPSFRID